MRRVRNCIAMLLAAFVYRGLRFLETRGYADDHFWRRCRLTCAASQGFGIGTETSNSGEQQVIAYLRSIIGPRPIILDIGANGGKYALEILSGIPYAILHCIEPQPEPFHRLIELVKDKPNVHVHKIAISDQNGEAIFYSDVPGSELGSLLNRRLDHFSLSLANTQAVATQSLEYFLSTQHIQEVSLLKLDIEGMEFPVLRSASKLLSTGRIKCVQFEFGGANIDSRTYFQDFYYLLAQDFHLFRITERRLIPVSAYTELDEVFITTNYLAIFKTFAEGRRD